MKFIKLFTVTLSALAVSSMVFAAAADAAGRKGSHRVGGYTKSGKGSHYVGGHRRR